MGGSAQASERKGGGGENRRRRLSYAVAAAAALAGIGVAGSALWTPAKAVLGQHLIAQAYASAQARPAGESVRPWAWADIAPMAKLRFPSLDGAERIVLDHASGEAMAWGPGWIRGSAPLGEPGLSGIAAHRDTHFALLEGVEKGDLIELETVDGVKAQYQVLRGEVVDSRTWRLPAIVDGPDLLALSTCWPFDALQIGPMRYVVFAARVAEPGEAGAPSVASVEAVAH